MKRQFVCWWKNSFIYKSIDNRISKHFSKKLKNDNFTILCSNCVGGVIYHRLGKEFLSPTINMYFSQPDFVTFCLHLDYYLQQKLVFIETNKGHPVAVLVGSEELNIPTIELNFNHANSNDEAREKWELRKKRVNKDNLYVILYMLDGLTVEQARKLEGFSCRNKVLLTAVPIPEISWSYYIKPNNHQQYASSYLGRNVFGVRWFEQKFDFVGFLNK